MKYQKGQEVYFVGNYLNQHKKVLTCGSKYMTLEGVRGKVDINTGKAHSTTGFFLGRVYASLEEYNNHLRVRKLIVHFRDQISGCNLQDITEEQLKQAYAIFGFSFPDIR